MTKPKPKSEPSLRNYAEAYRRSAECENMADELRWLFDTFGVKGQPNAQEAQHHFRRASYHWQRLAICASHGAPDDVQEFLLEQAKEQEESAISRTSISAYDVTALIQKLSVLKVRIGEFGCRVQASIKGSNNMMGGGNANP